MDDFMKIATQMVTAQAGVRAMSVEDMTAMIMELSKKLAGLSAGGGAAEAVATEPSAPAVDGRKSIKEGSITCCECGKKMKLITQRHLDTHGLTKAEYCAKHGLKKGQSLIAKGIARARKEKMKSMELWKRRKPKVAGAEAKPKAAAPAKKAAAKKAAPKKAAAPAAAKKD